jgi:hypothetical protein
VTLLTLCEFVWVLARGYGEGAGAILAGAGECWRRLTIIGRWRDMAGCTPRPDRRAERPCRVHRYIGQSNPYMDIDLAPVVDNEESAVISPQIIADNNA